MVSKKNVMEQGQTTAYIKKTNMTNSLIWHGAHFPIASIKRAIDTTSRVVLLGHALVVSESLILG